MRKTVVFVAVLFLSLLFAMPAYAAEWNIPELDMKISVPEGWIVFTRNMDENDPNFKMLTISREELMKDFEKKNIYFNALLLDSDIELSVTMSEDANTKVIGNLNQFDDNNLKIAAESTINAAYSTYNARFESYSFYKHSSITYINFSGWKEASPQNTYLEQYSTVVNGRATNITLFSYKGPILPEYSDALRSIVDSIEFTEVTPARDAELKDFSASLNAEAEQEVAASLNGEAKQEASPSQNTEAEQEASPSQNTELEQEVSPSQNAELEQEASAYALKQTTNRILSKGLGGLITGLILGLIALLIGAVRAAKKKKKAKQMNNGAPDAFHIPSDDESLRDK